MLSLIFAAFNLKDFKATEPGKEKTYVVEKMVMLNDGTVIAEDSVNSKARNTQGFNRVTSTPYEGGRTVIATSRGGPGTTLLIGRSVSVVATFTIGLGLDVEWFSAKLGFDITGTHTVSTSNSWTCPSTYLGKNVRTG